MAERIGDYADVCYELKRLSRLAKAFKLSKRLGQHMMIDCDLGIEMLERLNEVCPDRDCFLYELGAGLGFLTLFLKKYPGYVVTSEIDARFLDQLRKTFREDLVEVVASDGVPIIGSLRGNYVVVSNTPYVISSKVVASVVKSSARAAVLLLQEDVARKLSASPGSDNYGRITAFVRTFMNVRLGGSYPPHSFRPRPRVWSSVVVLERRRSWSHEFEGYEDFLRCLFTQRRRLLSKRLRECAGANADERLARLRVFNADPELLLQLYLALGARRALEPGR